MYIAKSALDSHAESRDMRTHVHALAAEVNLGWKQKRGRITRELIFAQTELMTKTSLAGQTDRWVQR